jgi:hypothetical protein
MSEENISRQQWKEFHYGKPKKKESKFSWTLSYNGTNLITGSYALCVWKMKKIIQDEGAIKKLFKIS